MILRVEMNEKDRNRISGIAIALGKSEKTLVKAAVNEAARRAKESLISDAEGRYTGKRAASKKNIEENSSIQKASGSNLSSTLRFASGVHEISQFHVNSMKVHTTAYTKLGKRRVRTVKGNVLEGGAKELTGAFVVRFKAGKRRAEDKDHFAVVKRVEGENMKKYAGKPRIPHYEKLEKVLSPSVPGMISKTYDPDKVADLLHEEVEKVLAKVLGG